MAREDETGPTELVSTEPNTADTNDQVQQAFVSYLSANLGRKMVMVTYFYQEKYNLFPNVHQLEMC